MPESSVEPERVEVPDLVGLTVPMARRFGHHSGVVVIGPDPDGPPLGALTWPGVWVVTAQDPAPGRSLRRGATVVILFEERSGGGPAGDQEPRIPAPPPRELRAEREPDPRDGR